MVAAVVIAALTLAGSPADAASAAGVAQATALQQWRGDANWSATARQTSVAAGEESSGEDSLGEEVVPGSLLVTMQPGRSYQKQSFAAAGYRRSTQIADGIVMIDVAPDETETAAQDLAGVAGVKAVEPNRIRRFTAMPNDPGYPEQWAHQVTGMEPAWDISTGSTDVLVAVADSGVVASHPDLGGIVEQVDASTGEIRPGALDNDTCKVGHGTWVSGVLAGVGNNGVGVTGVNWNLSILDINTADPSVSCSGPADSGTIAAIAYATQQGADVVNLSLGSDATSCPTAMQQVIDQATAAGTLVVASSGNGANDTPNVPASCNGAMSVGAVGPDSTVAP